MSYINDFTVSELNAAVLEIQKFEKQLRKIKGFPIYRWNIIYNFIQAYADGPHTVGQLLDEKLNDIKNCLTDLESNVSCLEDDVTLLRSRI